MASFRPSHHDTHFSFLLPLVSQVMLPPSLSLSPPLGPPIQIRLVKGCQRTFLPTTSEDQHNHPVDLYTLVPGLSSPG